MKPVARVARACAAAAVLSIAVAWPASAQQQSATSIEKLLSDGWEIAGYVAASENRSLILFKHKDHKHLVQCSILLDVLRNPRMVTYCYELK